MALYIFQQPQTWRIFTLGFYSFAVATWETGFCERAELRVTFACSKVAPVIPTNWPAVIQAGSDWCQRHKIWHSVTAGSWLTQIYTWGYTQKHNASRNILYLGFCVLLPFVLIHVSKTSVCQQITAEYNYGLKKDKWVRNRNINTSLGVNKVSSNALLLVFEKRSRRLVSTFDELMLMENMVNTHVHVTK